MNTRRKNVLDGLNIFFIIFEMLGSAFMIAYEVLYDVSVGDKPTTYSDNLYIAKGFIGFMSLIYGTVYLIQICKYSKNKPLPKNVHLYIKYSII